MKNSFNSLFSKLITSITSSLLICIIASAQEPSEVDSLLRLIDPTKQDTTQIKILSELGDLYYASQPDSAAACYHMALEMAKEIENPLAEAECLRAIGTVFQVTGEYDSALIYYAEARPMLEEIGDRDKTASCYNPERR
ncbi:MAG: tetratricopeptide repeat protein [Bacteroidota bacterium]|nr:tetratricopeptide repeat protein [Bacteroidota bacterium]